MEGNKAGKEEISETKAIRKNGENNEDKEIDERKKSSGMGDENLERDEDHNVDKKHNEKKEGVIEDTKVIEQEEKWRNKMEEELDNNKMEEETCEDTDTDEKENEKLDKALLIVKAEMQDEIKIEIATKSFYKEKMPGSEHD